MKQDSSIPLKSRGVIDVKGKGKQKTFWVNPGDGIQAGDLDHPEEKNAGALPPVHEVSEDFLSHELLVECAPTTKPTVSHEPDIEAPFDGDDLSV